MRIQKSHFSSKMKIGSKFYIHLSYSKVHFISKFLFFSCTATMAGHHASWSSAAEGPSLTELLLCKEHSDTTPITEAVMGHEDSVIFQVKKSRHLRISRELNFLSPVFIETLIMPLRLCFLLGKMKKCTCKAHGKIVSINLHLVLLAISSISNRNVRDVFLVSICQTSLRLSFLFPFCHSVDTFNQGINYSVP